MKLFYLLTALASASAFAPQAVNVRQPTDLSMDRRTAAAQIGIAASVVAGLPSVVLADGASSTSTIQRAKGIYGSRIAALKAAIKEGDFQAVAAEKSAFVLYNSGAYPGTKNKEKKANAIEGTNKIFAAIRAKDKSALKKAYDEYLALCEITGLPDELSKGGFSQGQGYSNDYDYRARTKAGAIYQR